MSKEEWISGFIKDGGNETVIRFIADIAWNASDTDCIHELFAAGYCYYFAAMLRIAFKRGSICHAYPYSHVVWVDEDEIAYDIDGICKEYKELIPIDGYGKILNSFRRVPGEELLPVEEQQKIVEDIRKTTAISKYGMRSYKTI